MSVKKVLLSEAKSGMELAQNILDGRGHLVAASGTILDADIIQRMESYGVIVIKVVGNSELDDPFMEHLLYDEEEVPEEPEQENGYYEKIRNTNEFKKFNNEFDKAIGNLEIEFNDIVVKHKDINIIEFVDEVSRVIEANRTNHSILEVLDCMRGYDDLTFAHSMNVSLICNMMAEWFGYSETDTEMLTVGGLLHDIGKVKIPKSVLAKPGKLTGQEYRVIRYHPLLGFEILKDQPISIKIKNAALMHHERYDGGGYPQGLKGSKIEEMARIVAVADVYDAMTAKRVYRDKMSPFSVIEIFEKEISHYDPEILLFFLQKIAQSYISSTVLLSNGEVGMVAMVNNSALGRPVVMTEKGAIDLAKDRSVNIVSMV